jgi:hypothetical protein
MLVFFFSLALLVLIFIFYFNRIKGLINIERSLKFSIIVLIIPVLIFSTMGMLIRANLFNPELSIEIFIETTAFSIGIVMILLIFIYLFNKKSGLTNLEYQLNVIINLFIIPFIILSILSVFIEDNFLFTIDLLIMLIYFILDIVIKRIIKEKIDQKKRKWNILRGFYFISFVVLQYSILHYSFMVNIDAGLIILILIITLQITFIVYLKKYEAHVFKQIRSRTNLKKQESFI